MKNNIGKIYFILFIVIFAILAGMEYYNFKKEKKWQNQTQQKQF